MPLHAATIFVSAFLLFLVQPIIAKQILPWFGGSAAVWTTCMVFFQFVLLAGYAYADALARLRPRVQAGVHTALLLVACASLPIIADAGWKPGPGTDPTWRILALLAVTIGLPYFLVSTTGPLVQSWFARAYAGDPRQPSVYRLFALSNFASLAALVAYPFVVEPYVPGRIQGWAWSAGFVVFAALAAATAWVSAQRIQNSDQDQALTPSAGTGLGEASPSWARQASWLVLSGLGVVFLLGITAHVTQNVASIPFLWIVPLSLYLLTFILCFDSQFWYRPRLFGPVLLILLPLMAWGLVTSQGVLHIEVALPLYCVGLFVVCMFCHGELASARPAPRWLTRFYLMISLGGALGGLLVGVAAPRVFSAYWELPIAIVACALCAIVVLRRISAVVAVSAVVSAGLVGWHALHYVGFINEDTRLMQRNFYGTIRVKEASTPDDGVTLRRMMHGVILHGEQYMQGEWRRHPTSYYGETSGAGLALLLAPDPKRVGVIGLGAGTLAVYGNTGDNFRFYEINPQVAAAARSQFGYLSDSEATVEIALGDARLVLEDEATHGRAQGFDVLVVDAFSSDAIPVHLITREALTVYRRHMRPGGVIAFHVTNRYLRLAPVVKQLADEVGLAAVLVADDPVNDSLLSSTDYVLVTEDRSFLAEPAVAERSVPIETIPGLLPWTDDYNNLFRILK